MSIKKVLMERRTIRLFQQKSIPDKELADLIDCARVCSCASNLQQLRFIVIREKALVEQVFPHTAWANLVKPSRTPVKGETAPVAFIAVIAAHDANNTIYADAGAAIQSMQSVAWDKGIGCCWLGSINREELKKMFNLPENKQVLYLLALGYPAEKPISEDIKEGESVFYYLDEEQRLHVPKICLEDIASWR